MSLFTASPLLRSSLTSTRSVLGTARCVPASFMLAQQAPRSLTTTPVARALPWAKHATTRPVSLEQDFKELNVVRNERPTSPHFTIYQPQLTWLSSIVNRITGAGLSLGLYGFMSAYAAAPLMGWTDCLSSAHLVQVVATMPYWAKLAVKVPLAAAFSFHTFNGLRHLSWDMGYFLSLKTSYIAGYTTIGLSLASTIYLSML
ncbi:cytochrome b subunit of succinate dehydrogenase, Sdh3p [Malassezia brasiliensis]|uniref:Cytochrome b subunit of succinate dehydrogenase, Sdh3p n=1 Tax=Malassezia brasiliensis TaxID=1821822 RepID=A0AAF0DYM4_9BASI|nr:cytochrome b subunit of succinate dehydrogenase, Sdh3p [Malassezia brasiliensis]